MTNEHYAYMLTVDKKYWNRLCQRNSARIGTHVFIRKNRVATQRSKTSYCFMLQEKSRFWALPEIFLSVLTGNYEDSWEKFGSESCFESFEE